MRVRRATIGRVARGGAMFAATAVALVAWAFSSPAGSAPDGDYHFATIWCGAGVRPHLCELASTSRSERLVPRGLVRYAGPLGHFCYVGNPGASAGCLRDVDPTVATTMVPTQRGSVEYYSSNFTRLLSRLASGDIEAAGLRIRLWNVAIGLAALAAVALLAPGGVRALGLALVAMGAPVGIFFVASAHPQSWVFSLLPTGWLVADAAVARGRERRSPWWVAAVALGAAMVWLAYDARPQDGWLFGSAVAILLVVRHAPAAAGDCRLRGGLAVVGIAAAGLIVRRVGGLDGLVDQLRVGDADRAWGHLVASAPGAVRDLVAGGNALGSGDVPMPAIVGVLGILGVGTAMAAAHVRLSRRAWATCAVLVGLVAYLPWRQGDVGVSGRYVWVLAAIALTYYLLECRPGGVDVGAMPRAARRVIVAAAGLANAFALHAHIRRYVTGSDVVGWNLNRGAEWWWPSGPAPMTTWLLGSAAFALAAGLVVFPARREP